MNFWRHLFGGKDDTPNEHGRQAGFPAQWVKMDSDDPVVFAHLHNQQVSQLIALDHFEQALSTAEEAESSMRFLLGKNTPTHAMTLNSLAVLYYEMGDFAEAEP